MVDELTHDTDELRQLVGGLVFEYEDSNFSFDEEALFNDLETVPTRTFISLGFRPEPPAENK